MLLPRAVSTGVISLGGNWFSASKGYALTDSDILSHLLVEGGSVTTCSSVDLKGTFAASGSWSFSTLLFPKKKLFQKFHEVNDTPATLCGSCYWTGTTAFFCGHFIVETAP